MDKIRAVSAHPGPAAGSVQEEIPSAQQTWWSGQKENLDTEICGSFAVTRNAHSFLSASQTRLGISDQKEKQE